MRKPMNARSWITPTRFLAAVNVAVTGLLFVQGVISARLLGPSAYGVIAVIAAINATVSNFVDVRLYDLVGKLYYPSLEDNVLEIPSFRGGVILVYLAVTALISIAAFAAGILANVLTVQFFTSATVSPAWIVASAGFLAIQNLLGALAYQQRFSGMFYLMGWGKLVSSVVAIVAFLAILLQVPTVDGYYYGSIVGATLQVALAAILSYWIWVRYQGLKVLRSGILSAWAAYRGHLRFVFMGNLLGYNKMLHRGADVLVVGFFSDDRVTGLYKVARSFTDALYMLFDSLNQVYQPRFLELLAKGDTKEYRRLARRLLLGIAGLTLLVIGAEVLVLPLAIPLALTSKFAGAEGAIVVLTVPFLFVAGFYLWLWPVFVHSGKLGRYTSASFVAAAVQYGLVALLFTLVGPSPTMAAAAYLGYYLVLIPVSLLLVWVARPEVIPSVRNRQGGM